MPFYAKGRYKCLVTENGIAENERTGNPYVYVRFIVKATTDGNTVDKEYHRELQRAITEKTIPYLGKDLKYLSPTIKSFLQMDPAVRDGVNLEGQEFVFECDINKNDYEEWQIPFGGGGTLKEVKKLDKSKFADLHKRFGAQFSASLVDDKDASPY